MNIKWRCSVQGCYLKKALVDWSYLNGILPRNIRVSDIDGIVEANGRFLVLESKSASRDVPRGQERMFQAMSKTGYMTVMILWGVPPAITHRQIYHLGKIGEKVPCDQVGHENLVKRWIVWADAEWKY